MEEKEHYFSEYYRQCYMAYGRALRTFIYGMVRDALVADELLHDVFLKLLERDIPLDPAVGTTRGFLFMVAKNRCLDFLRKRTTEEKTYRKMVVQEAIINDRFYRDVEDMHIEGEVITTLYDVINEFPERKREIFIKKALLNKRITEIMKEMGVSSFMVHKIIREVYREIRLRLRPFFEDDEC